MIVFICPYLGFPNGTAPTGRLTGYAKGLNELGKDVYILLPETSENADTILNYQVKGNVDGINFEYTCGTTERPKSFLRRRLITFRGIFIATVRLFQLMSKNKIEALIIYPDYLLTTLWFWSASRLKRIPFLLEKSEHPFFAAGEKPKSRIYQFLYTRIVLNRFDGVMVIGCRKDACRYIDGIQKVQKKVDLLKKVLGPRLSRRIIIKNLNAVEGSKFTNTINKFYNLLTEEIRSET